MQIRESKKCLWGNEKYWKTVKNITLKYNKDLILMDIYCKLLSKYAWYFRQNVLLTGLFMSVNDFGTQIFCSVVFLKCTAKHGYVLEMLLSGTRANLFCLGYLIMILDMVFASYGWNAWKFDLDCKLILKNLFRGSAFWHKITIKRLNFFQLSFNFIKV